MPEPVSLELRATQESEKIPMAKFGGKRGIRLNDADSDERTRDLKGTVTQVEGRVNSFRSSRQDGFGVTV